MKLLVTGGAGFIGSHLTEELVSKGHEVVVIDSLFSGKLENLENIIDKIHFHKADITNQAELTPLFKGIDYVFHLAARRAVPASFKDPLDYNHTNIDGTLNVLDAARQNNVKRVIFASSSSVYGNGSIPSTEGKEGLRLSPYAITKEAGEEYCRMFNEQFGFETVSLRYFNVFGPRQDPESNYATAIPRFIYAYLNGGQPIIFGDGTHTRDFTYVENVVHANILAMTKNVTGKVLNVATGYETSVNDLSKMIAKELGKEWNPQYIPLQQKEPERTRANLRNSTIHLGYMPQIQIEEGIRRTISYFRKKEK